MKTDQKTIDIEWLKAKFANIRVFGECDRKVARALPIDIAGPGDIAFCSMRGEGALKLISKCNAGILICGKQVPQIAPELAKGKCIVIVDNPRLAFLRCLDILKKRRVEWGIHQTAIVHPDVVLPNSVKIGAYAIIESGVVIGEGTVVEDRVHLGRGSTIGKNVYLQTGCIIGCEGQGFERNERMEFEKFYQQGTVIIEDEVEIGANSTIVRGTFSATRIGRGSKVGHLTDVGHNVQIGFHTFVSASVLIGGSTSVGDYCWLAPKCCIRNKVKIGDHVTVGLGAVVIKNIQDGITVFGNPARPI
jgi:UDP-3-O-[3-hydroxymyristoyl] glucosamine N-acyltransferase